MGSNALNIKGYSEIGFNVLSVQESCPDLIFKALNVL